MPRLHPSLEVPPVDGRAAGAHVCHNNYYDEPSCTMTSQAVPEVQSTSAQPRMETDVTREKTFINYALLHEAIEIGINEGVNV